ncbi:MAG: FtsQ-type POTRA domain-containing protein [Spirochaetaceae bacterium]|jgi:cell division protein FtsQ|nr:FtsQ-type POTRA domain-containing protein [Spirochaetaceae bacterium]
MKDKYIQNEDIEEGAKEPSFKYEKALKKFVFVLCILLGAEFVWLFIVSPCMPLSRINVSGMDTFPKSLVLSAAEITAGSSYMSINEKRAKDNLEKLPQVETAVVSKRFPDTLNIKLTPRRAAAFSLTGAGKSLPALIDGNGVVFSIGKPKDGALPETPLISGLFEGDVETGYKAGDEYKSLLSNLLTLKENSGELLDSISEIYINRKASGTFDLIVYPEYTKTKIRMSALNEDKLRYMLLLLDVFAEKNMDVEEIDFRTGTASYKIRGHGGSNSRTTYALENVYAAGGGTL